MTSCVPGTAGVRRFKISTRTSRRAASARGDRPPPERPAGVTPPSRSAYHVSTSAHERPISGQDEDRRCVSLPWIAAARLPPARARRKRRLSPRSAPRTCRCTPPPHRRRRPRRRSRANRTSAAARCPGRRRLEHRHLDYPVDPDSANYLATMMRRRRICIPTSGTIRTSAFRTSSCRHRRRMCR